MKPLVVDFDGVLFKAALYGQDPAAPPSDTLMSKTGDYVRVYSTRFSPAKAKEYIAAFMAPLHAAYANVILAVSSTSRRYWRHDVLPTYKGKRSGQERPIGMDHLDAWFDHAVLCVDNMEADDVCSVMMSQEGAHCYSPDKDLKTVAGTLRGYQMHYANRSCAFDVEEPTEEASPVWTLGPTTTRTEEEAFWFFCWQCLAGDSCDGLPGCPGVGEKTANKLLDPLKEATKTAMWTAVAKAYEDAANKGKLPASPLMQQAQCLRMKRAFDEPLWTPTMEGICYGR